MDFYSMAQQALQAEAIVLTVGGFALRESFALVDVEWHKGQSGSIGKASRRVQLC